MNKHILKKVLLFIVFFVVIFISTNVYATNTNYEKFKDKVEKIYKISNNKGFDITEELLKYLEASKVDKTNGKSVMIYIPSGKYFVGDNGNIVLHSNTYLIAEDDTEIIKKKNTSNSLIRTRAAEDPCNITIYGGIWNGNISGKYAIEIMNAENVVIENCTIKNSKNNGLNINNSVVNINDIEVFNNNEHGISCSNNSNAKLTNSSVYGNKQYGIMAADSNLIVEKCTVRDSGKNGININSSKGFFSNINVYNNGEHGISDSNNSEVQIKNSSVYTNKYYGIIVAKAILNGNNINVYNNYCSGISATGSNSKVYLTKSEINKNGTNIKYTANGALGHGIGIFEGAYAELNNSKFNNNNQCGISVYENATVKIYNNDISNNGRHGIGARYKVEMLTISNNKINKNSYNGVLVAEYSEAILSNNKIQSNKQNGVSVVDKSVATFESNVIKSNAKNNIVATKGDKNKRGSKIILKSKNEISNSAKENGISVAEKGILEITGKNNKISKNRKNGIIATRDSKVIIKGSKTTVESNKNNGIYISSSSKGSMKNVTVKKNSKYGVSVDKKGNFTISDSTIKENKNYGINVSDNGTKVKIEKNNIYKNAKIGIMVKNKASVSNIYKNIIKNNAQTGIHIKGKSKVSSIKKNTITGHTKYGIAIYESKKPKMRDNKLSNKEAKEQTYYKK